MKHSRYNLLWYIILSVTIIFSIGGATACGQNTTTPSSSVVTSVPSKPSGDTSLEIHFLDVGQGLSIFARCGDQTMLYDGGDRNYSSFVVAYLKEQGVTDLDYIIASHYDADHINGLVGALHAFPVKNLIGPDYTAESKVYQSFSGKAAELNLEVQHPTVGDSYSFGSAAFTVLAPDTISDDSNNNSIAIKIDHGQNSFILTGDAEHDSEKAMVSSGLDLDCDVLVLGHHGSASSTTWDFLQQSVPEYAIISCGDQNSYGHPHEETLEKLDSMEIEYFRTDRQGTIIAVSEANSITWNMSPYNEQDLLTAQEIIAETTLPDEVLSAETTYVLNTNTKKVHLPSCSSAAKIAAKNYDESNDSLETILDQGYTRCGNCLSMN